MQFIRLVRLLPKAENRPVLWELGLVADADAASLTRRCRFAYTQSKIKKSAFISVNLRPICAGDVAPAVECG